MLGKASEIKVYLVVEMYGVAIDDEISKWLDRNPNVQVLGIKFSITPDTDKSIYHEALIIYKEESAWDKPDARN